MKLNNDLKLKILTEYSTRLVNCNIVSHDELPVLFYLLESVLFKKEVNKK